MEEIEQAGLRPRLVHARKAKLMMGQINKTDQLDGHGLNTLHRNGTLPTVWIPPGPLREVRELTRTRVALVAQRTRWKNRITARLAKYGLPASEYGDPYGKGARAKLERRLEGLPEQTRWAARQMLAQLDSLSTQIEQFEQRLKWLVEITPEMQHLMSLPGVGVILAATMALEIGAIGRFASAERLASYAGTTPTRGRQWKSRALRADAPRCEPLSEVGLCGSLQLGGRQSHPLLRPARQPTLLPPVPAQRTQPGGGRRGAPLGRGRPPCPHPPGAVSRSKHEPSGSDLGGVSAKLS